MAIDLMHLLSNYFKPIIEFQQIMRADGAAMEDFEKNTLQICENCFIQTCDEKTIGMYETRFGIVSMPGETLEYRRQRLLQKYNTIVPFSIGFLKNRLTELYEDDYALSVDPKACKLKIAVTSSRYGAVDLLYELLWDIIPAHMEVIANQQVTNYVSGNIHTAEVMVDAFIQTI